MSNGRTQVSEVRTQKTGRLRSRSLAVSCRLLASPLRRAASALAVGCWLLASFLPGSASASVWTTDGTDSLFASIEKLEFHNVSINRSGTVTLAPNLFEKAAPGDNTVWCACRDQQGNVWFGTGSTAKLYRLNRGTGKPELVHDGGTGEILAVTCDAAGNILFAVTPEAKVYRIKPGGKPELFFETFEKYVFSLLPAADGSVYCATGEHGKLYRIPANGKGVEIFAAPQAQLATLAWLSPDKELLVGTSPDGIVYRLDLAPGHDRAASVAVPYPSGVSDRVPSSRPAVSVIYDTPLAEVRSIVVDADNVYIGANPEGTPSGDSAGPKVYSVKRDGTLNWSWTSPDSTLFAMCLSSRSTTSTPQSKTQNPKSQIGNLLVATGIRGLVYELDPLGRASVRHKTAEFQALCLVPAPEGTWLGTGNSARLYLATRGYADSGFVESPPFDCANPARFGRFDWRGSVPAGTSLDFDTRSGYSETPDSTWHNWVAARGAVASEPARFIQWRARLATQFPDRTPEVRRVDLNYGIANRPPVIRKLEIAALSLDDARKGAAKPTRTVTWEATDPDDDSLDFDLFFRREGETGWQRVAHDISDNKFDLDTRALADGWYELRLLASDRIDRVPGTSDSTEFISKPFTVDNTAPVVSDLRVTGRSSLDISHSTLAVSFTVSDALSPVVSCRVTSNAGDWQPAEPKDGLFDSTTETFSVELAAPPGPATIAVIAADAQGNIATARTQVR